MVAAGLSIFACMPTQSELADAVVIEGPYLGQTITMPAGKYSSSGTKVTFVSERQIDISEFNNTAPDAYFYLGYGGNSASDYKSRGLEVSLAFQSVRNHSFTINLDNDLSALPYSHIAIICKRYTAMINVGIQYRNP